MKLRAYLKTLDAEGKKRAAVRFGCKMGYLSQLSGGHRNASGKLALKIERETAGMVTRHDLRPDLYPLDDGARRRHRDTMPSRAAARRSEIAAGRIPSDP